MSSMKSEECLNFVSQILNVLKTTNQYEKVFSMVVDRVSRIFQTQTCAIIIVNPKTEYLNVAASEGISHTFSKAFRQTIAAGAVGRLIWTGKPVLIENSDLQPDLAKEVKLEQPFGSCLCVQISVDNHTIGYLHADCARPNAFSANDIPVIQGFADFAGIAYEKARLSEENLQMDRIDHETGLEKLTSFLEGLQATIARGVSFGESFALILFDVDNFKNIALTYGYETSKVVLKEIADLLKSQLRCIDVGGRYGFDEIILMRAHTSLDDAVLFADQLRQKIEQAEFTNQRIKTTVSVGVAGYPQDGLTVQPLLLVTKEALFEARRSGRNRVFHFSHKEQVQNEQLYH